MRPRITHRLVLVLAAFVLCAGHAYSSVVEVFISGPANVCAVTTNRYVAICASLETNRAYAWKILSNSPAAYIAAYIPGATNGVAVEVVSPDQGSFVLLASVTIGGDVFSATSNVTVQAQVSAAPLSDQIACAGSDVAFNLDPGSGGPHTFVWRKDSIAIPGATSETLSLTNVTGANEGSYCVEVTGFCGSVTNCATLTVIVPASLTCPSNLTVSCLADVPDADTNSVVVTNAVAILHLGDAAATNGCAITITRTYGAVNSCNVTTLCAQVITILDTTPPVLTCTSGLVVECGAAWDFGPVSATDNCGDTNVFIAVLGTATNHLCGNTYAATRTWLATDNCGNTNSCSQTITITDTTLPQIVCSSNLLLECAGPTGTPAVFGTTATDSCDGIVTVACDPPSGSLFALGTNSVLCVATDACGNSNSCTFTVTVRDTTPPVITCASNLVAECGAAWDFGPVSATDHCGDTNVIITVLGTVTNSLCGNTYAVTRTWLATDSSGNTNTCSQTITITDTTLPQIVCSSNLLLECAGPEGTPAVYGSIATDSCDDNVTVACYPPSGSLFALGTNSVLCVAIDACGNSNSCTFTVTVRDTAPPLITCPVDLVVLESPAGSGGAAVSLPSPIATDLCDDSLQLTSEPASGFVFPIGSTTVVWTALDDTGNSNACAFTVRVVPAGLILVTTTEDSGPGSLRQAILDANLFPDSNLIQFPLDGPGPHAIHLLSALTPITSPVVIDGWSLAGSNLPPVLVLDGGGGSNAFAGLVVQGGSSTVRGLILQGFATAIQLEVNGSNVIQGNWIGSEAANGPGNSGDGILVASVYNQIGGLLPGEGNLIAHCDGNGVTVVSGLALRNTILGNAISENGGLGIDLGDDGLTPNDGDDEDSGPNDLQNFPTLSEVKLEDGNLVLTGALASRPGRSYRIEFFLNDNADPTGHGEGQTFVGAFDCPIQATNPAGFSATFPVSVARPYATATATDPEGNTSEFSPALAIISPPVVVIPPIPTNAPLGSDLTFCTTAIGTPPFQWQWRLNGVNIPGATNSCYTITEAQVADGGSYSCVIVNTYGVVSTVSAPYRLPLPVVTPGDNFADRVEVSGRTNLFQGSNRDATFEAGEPRHAGKQGGKSVWYTWSPPITGVASFRTAGSTFDTLLGIYSGTSVTGLTATGGDEDRGGFYTSGARFNAIKNRDYQIAIDGFGGATGDFVLGWDLEDTPKLLPVIVLQPVSQTVVPGTTVMLSTVGQRVCGGGHANCPDPTHYPGNELPQLYYAWYFKNQPIPGAHEPSLVIPNVQPEQVGNYRARVSTQWQYVDSDDALLQINDTSGQAQGVLALDKFLDALNALNYLIIGQPVTVAPNGPGAEGGVEVPSNSGGVVRGFTGTQIFNTTGAATEPGEVICGVAGGASEWITFIAEASGTLYLNTDGSSYDTVIAVLRRSPTNAAMLEVLGCDNNGGLDGFDSALEVTVQAGQTNFIVVDGVNAATGILKLNYSLATTTVLNFLGRTPQGANLIQINGRTDMHFSLQASADLVNWTTLMTTNSPAASMIYEDNTAANLPGRLYRALLLP